MGWRSGKEKKATKNTGLGQVKPAVDLMFLVVDRNSYEPPLLSRLFGFLRALVSGNRTQSAQKIAVKTGFRETIGQNVWRIPSMKLLLACPTVRVLAIQPSARESSPLLIRESSA